MSNDERAAFEAAMGSALIAEQGEFALSRAYEEGRPYTFLATKWAWAAWQAAYQRAQPSDIEITKHDFMRSIFDRHCRAWAETANQRG